jgi:hypothetical protein
VYIFQALIHPRQALRAQYHVAEFTGERERTITPAPVEQQRRPRERAALRGTVSSGVRSFYYVVSCHGAVCVDKRDDPAELAQFHATQTQQQNYPHLASLPVETLRFASLGSSYIEPCSLQRDWRRGRPDATVASGRLNLAFFSTA